MAGTVHVQRDWQKMHHKEERLCQWEGDGVSATISGHMTVADCGTTAAMVKSSNLAVRGVNFL